VPAETSYLHRSRHGIWYYRWVVPHAGRSRRKFNVKFDPVAGRSIEVDAQPHEVAAALEVVEQVQAANLRVAQMLATTHVGQQGRSEPSPAVALCVGMADVADTDTPPSPPSKTISQAFDEFANQQVRGNGWSEQTREHTHAPTNRFGRLGPGIVDADVAEKRSHRERRPTQDTSASRLS
jgi:hypothetical protein